MLSSAGITTATPLATTIIALPPLDFHQRPIAARSALRLAIFTSPEDDSTANFSHHDVYLLKMGWGLSLLFPRDKESILPACIAGHGRRVL